MPNADAGTVFTRRYIPNQKVKPSDTSAHISLTVMFTPLGVMAMSLNVGNSAITLAMPWFGLFFKTAAAM